MVDLIQTNVNAIDSVSPPFQCKLLTSVNSAGGLLQSEN